MPESSFTDKIFFRTPYNFVAPFVRSMEIISCIVAYNDEYIYIYIYMFVSLIGMCI